MLMNDKIMFDRYYCINSTKHCENEDNIGALYFITSPHFPTRVRYCAIFGPRSSTHNLACALRDAQGSNWPRILGRSDFSLQKF